MKEIQLLRHARPDEACDCVEVADVGAPGKGEVVVEMKASAINPADLLIMEGRYPGPEVLPAAMGIEGAGRVLQVGDGVDNLQPGDKVISLGRANWAERVKAPADRVVKLPEGLDFTQAAMLKANPPSAHFMLKDYVDLKPGDWVIQNAANSAVGRHVIRLARARGLHSVNIVRRESLVAELKAHGGDVVVVDGDDLAQRVRDETGAEAPIRLGIDAVGGSACQRLADCLSDDGVVVNYGFLSGDPCMITPHQAIIHGITLKGFWLVRVMQGLSRDQIEALYAEMAGYFMDGTLEVPVEASYGLSEAKAALAHAWRAGRDGKIVLKQTPD